MPEIIENPVTVLEVTGPGRDKLSPGHVTEIVYPRVPRKEGTLIRNDLATLMRLYSIHFRAAPADPFAVDVDCLYALERENLLTLRWERGDVKVELHAA
jgi:hypothetical protein